MLRREDAVSRKIKTYTVHVQRLLNDRREAVRKDNALLGQEIDLVKFADEIDVANHVLLLLGGGRVSRPLRDAVLELVLALGEQVEAECAAQEREKKPSECTPISQVHT